MNRRHFIQIAPMALAGRAAAAPRKRPNFLFIYTDDQRWDAIAALGRQKWLRTPNLDRLVRRGAAFRNAFVTTSLCSPSRSSYLTGCYPHRTGVAENTRGSVLRDDVPTVFQYLREAGYGTAYVGKVHIPNFLDKDRGCDYVASFPGQGAYFNNRFVVNGTPVRPEGYITDRITGFALDYLKQRDRSQAFRHVRGPQGGPQPLRSRPEVQGSF
jgi:N-acetylglucosamine-6-sulfatase